MDASFGGLLLKLKQFALGMLRDEGAVFLCRALFSHNLICINFIGNKTKTSCSFKQPRSTKCDRVPSQHYGNEPRPESQAVCQWVRTLWLRG